MSEIAPATTAQPDLENFVPAIICRAELLTILKNGKNGAGVILYNPVTKSWSELKLSDQNELVVVTSLPNNGPIQEIFNLRHGHLLLDPRQFGPETKFPKLQSIREEIAKRTDAAREYFTRAFSESVQTIIGADSLNKRNEKLEKQRNIRDAADHLANVLAETPRETGFWSNVPNPYEVAPTLVIQYKPNSDGSDSIVALRELIRSTGSMHSSSQHREVSVEATIESEDEAHFLMEILLDRLISLFPKSLDLPEFKKTIGSMDRDLFTVHAKLKNERSLLILSLTTQKSA